MAKAKPKFTIRKTNDDGTHLWWAKREEGGQVAHSPGFGSEDAVFAWVTEQGGTPDQVEYEKA